MTNEFNKIVNEPFTDGFNTEYNAPMPSSEDHLYKEPVRPGKDYKVLSADQTANYRVNKITDRIKEVQKSKLSNEDKDAMIKDLKSHLHSIIKSVDNKGLEQSFIDPIDMVSGPLAFSNLAARSFGKITLGKLAGKGILKFSDHTLTKALTAALATEVPLGQGLDLLEEKMTEEELPGYIKTPIILGASLLVGGYAQQRAENAIDALASGMRKRGIDVSPKQIKKAITVAKSNIEDEVSLIPGIKNLTETKVKARVKKPLEIKTAKNETRGARVRRKISEKEPIFEDQKVTANDKFADLKTVKKLALVEGAETFDDKINAFPDTFAEAEGVEEFFTNTGPSTRHLVKRLKAAGYEGVSDQSFTKKFFSSLESERPSVPVSHKEKSKELLQHAKAHAGANSVTGFAGGIYAGIETDDDGNVTGFNPAKALTVGLAAAVGGAALIRHSKFIAGLRGYEDLPVSIKKEEKELLKEAKKLISIETDPAKVGMLTGWFQGVDGKLRKYVPTKEAALIPSAEEFYKFKTPVKVNKVLDYPMLKKYYGKSILKDLTVEFNPSIDTLAEASFQVPNSIAIHKISSHKQLLRNILHETQHAIQFHEGLSAGTNIGVTSAVYDNATRLYLQGGPFKEEQRAFLKLFQQSLVQIGPKAQAKIMDLIVQIPKVPADMALNYLKNGRKIYGEAAYAAAYGETEARLASQISLDEYIRKLTTFNLLTDKKSTIEIGSLIKALWNTLEGQETIKVMEAISQGSSRIKKKAVRPSVFERWQKYSNKRIIVPITHWVDSKIYNEALREQLGIKLPRKYRELVRSYDRQTDRLLDHTAAIAKNLDRLAPTQKEQKHLLQVLRGGVTSDPEKVQAAQVVKKLFKELRDTGREMGLKSYDMYDALTKAERRQLRDIIRFSSSKKRVLQAQESLKNHYKVGTAYEYVPTFLKSKEGVVGSERKRLKKRLSKLKALARAATDIYDDEPLPHFKDEIAELEDVLAINSSNAFNTKRKQLSQSYVNVMSPVEANEYLFKTEKAIHDASFTAARGLAEQALDIHRNSFLTAISQNPDWVLPKSVNPELVPRHFKRLIGRQYGDLSGMYVDRDIAKDISDSEAATSAFTRGYDKIMGFWKLGKAVWNPATQAANTVSNIFLAHLGGVSPGDLTTYTQAAQAMRTRMSNKWFREAEGWGLFNNTFSAAELSQFRKTLADFRLHPKTITTGLKVRKAIGKALSYPPALYEKNEQMFKLAVFIKARKKGKSVEEAAKQAETYLFNYRDIPPIVRHYKRWASPFFTFTYKATGAFAKTIIEQPHKLALWGAAYLAWQKYAEHKTGVSPEQVKREKREMPGFGPLDILLPWKDVDGNDQYWDISRLVPLGQYSDKFGQTGLPLGSFAPTANPFITTLYELAANKDLFIGKEIYSKDTDSLMTLLGKMALHTYKEMAPSLAPGNYGFNNLAKGIKSLDKDIVDFTGQEVTLQDMILRSVFAIKVTSATEQAMSRSLRSEIMRIDRDIGKQINKYKTQFMRHEINETDYNNAVETLIKRRNFLKQDLYKQLK